MQMKREVGEKGQIVLPKDIREYFNLKPGTRIIFEIRGNEVVLRPERTGEEFVSYFCRTSRKPKKKISAKAIKKAIEEQYDLR